MKEIRTLRANEIDVRVQSFKKDGTSACFLLYKDARCDMNILDETFGAYNWQREHFIRENIINGQRTMVNYCRVSIYDPDKGEWIAKEDVGTESNTENVKGESSDSFKRACVCWGIGRELYSAPSIWVSLNEKEVRTDPKGNYTTNMKLSVSSIEYDTNRNIQSFVLVDDKGKERFRWLENKTTKAPNSNTLLEKINHFTTVDEVNSVMTLVKYSNKDVRTAFLNRTKFLNLEYDATNNMYIQL